MLAGVRPTRQNWGTECMSLTKLTDHILFIFLISWTTVMCDEVGMCVFDGAISVAQMECYLLCSVNYKKWLWPNI